MSLASGMLVVCVDAAHTNTDDEAELVRGHVYTVRDVIRCENSVRLCELNPRRSKLVNETSDLPFWAVRFRPVDENRIAVFKRIAASPRERIEVSA